MEAIQNKVSNNDQLDSLFESEEKIFESYENVFSENIKNLRSSITEIDDVVFHMKSFFDRNKTRLSLVKC